MDSYKSGLTLRQYVESDLMAEIVAWNVGTYRRKWAGIVARHGDRLLADPALPRLIAGRAGWNWPGLLFGPFWAVWRGARGGWQAYAVTCLSLVAGIFAPDSIAARIGGSSGIAFGILFAMRGNAWYLCALVNHRDDLAARLRPSLLRLSLAVGGIVAILALAIAGGDPATP